MKIIKTQRVDNMGDNEVRGYNEALAGPEIHEEQASEKAPVPEKPTQVQFDPLTETRYLCKAAKPELYFRPVLWQISQKVVKEHCD